MQRRERILAIAVGVLVGGWLLDGAVAGPLLSWYDGVREAARAAEAEAAQSRALIDRQVRIMADWRGRHAAGLLDDESAARFRMQAALADAARTSGVSIDSIGGGQLVPASRDEHFDTVRLTASGQGALAQVIAFVNQLSGASQPLRIERSELSASDPRKDAIEFSLTASARLVPAAARAERSVPEGTRPWQAEAADTAVGTAVVEAKPFLAERRGGRAATSEPVRAVATAPGGWALVGIVNRPDGATAFLRHLGDGSERTLTSGGEIDGQAVSLVDAEGLVLGSGESAKRIAVGCGLDGAPVAVAGPARRPAAAAATATATPAPAPAGAAAPAGDPARESILERLRQQRNRTP